MSSAMMTSFFFAGEKLSARSDNFSAITAHIDSASDKVTRGKYSRGTASQKNFQIRRFKLWHAF
jgi:hypothetical protein